jgi:PPK2 family polyphosphate:nucleotide phosphotransferase
MSKKHRVENGKHFRLKDVDPDDTGQFKSKEEALAATEGDILALRELGERFYVDHRRALLVVLQAMDTGGKDGTIKHVFSGLNPVGTQVTSFKAPTAEELDHDFLWRINKALPRRGSIGIFNRSHYEDVLVVRVHELVKEKVWRRRYEHINNFEHRLAEEGTLILKFFLHIGKDEQKRRLEERLEKKQKHWKFDPADLVERKHWQEYMDAYEDVVRECSAPDAPWYVVPADKKWYRNYVVANAIKETLASLDYQLPKLKFDPKKIRVE